MSADESKHAAEVVHHLTAMARQQREEHEANVRDLGFASLVEKCRNGGKVSTKELLQVLAVAKRSREAFYPDDPNVKIPADLIDAIGIAVGGMRSWRAAVRGNKDKAAQLEDVVGEKARERLAKDPSVRAAAVAISKELGGRGGSSVRNLRRIIARIKRELAKTQTWPHTP